MMKRTLLFVGFFVGSFLSGMIAAMSRNWRMELGFASAVMFCCDFIWNRRWVLVFPTVQRPLFYSFKRGIPACIKRAFKLSSLAFLCSLLLSAFLPHQYKNMGGVGKFIVQLIYSYIASLSISFCWELSHHLLQVVHTRRCSFAPPQGSAAAETNPSELLLEALEQSTPRSLMQYLAYLDLCMVSESNVEPWRRAAFFEESGETYRRIVSVCLRPLEQLTSKIGEGLEGFCADKSDLLAQQLNSSATTCVDMKIHEAFNDVQICIWCARTVASLTARSHKEDRYGVAQLTNCNIAVVSTLLSSLLAVEACLGKKTSLQPTQILGPASINWVTSNTGRRNGSITAAPSKKRGGVIYAKAYIMADVLKTSIYQIICTFQSDMQANLKASVLEKNWIMDGKPLYSTREILVQKLLLFMDFRAN